MVNLVRSGNLWKPGEWELVERALEDFRLAFSWSECLLKQTLTGDDGQLIIYRQPASKGGRDYSAITRQIDHNKHVIELSELCFNGVCGQYADKAFYARGTLVHELMHVWDLGYGTALSDMMMLQTKSRYIISNGKKIYQPSGHQPYEGTTKCGHRSHLDDFAEAGSVYIYGTAYDNDQGQYMDETRLSFISMLVYEWTKRCCKA